MVDPGELVNVTLKREFAEEALNSLELDEDHKELIQESVDEVFRNGKEVYLIYYRAFL